MLVDHPALANGIMKARAKGLAHVPAKWKPVRQGEPLFADKDMRQIWNLRRFPCIWDHSVIPYERKTP
jgi:hypothetical protein